MYSIDIETKSGTSIKLGVKRYVHDRHFQVLIASVKNLETGKFEDFDFYHDGISQRWIDIIKSDVKWAFNAEFEKTCIEKQLGIKTDGWYCTMVHAYLNGGSGSLDGVNALFKTGVKKNPEGKRLIKKFSIDMLNPDEHIEDWELFKMYCRQDVEAESAIKCLYNKFDDKMFNLHLEINARGVKLDIDLVKDNIVAGALIKDKAEKAINNMGLTNPRSFKQKQEWFKNHGIKTSSTDKSHLDIIYEQTDNPEVKSLIELLRSCSATSTSKYQKMLESQVNGRVYNMFRMATAGTHRFSSGIVQLQNLARGYSSYEEIDEARKNIDTLEKSRDLLRACIIGNLTVADFSGIEARVLAWLAQDSEKLQRIRDGIDLYKVNASKLYNVPYENVDSKQRFSGKTMELALGYQGGTKAMEAFGAGKVLSDFEISEAVKVWRQLNYKTRNLWYTVDQVSNYVYDTHTGAYIDKDLCWYMDYRKGDLLMHLPNGTFLVYKNVKRKSLDGKLALTYQKAKQSTLTEVQLFGGKLVENATQAIAYQLLRNSLINVDRQGYLIVAHVHDEIIVDQENVSLEHLISVMTQVPDWACLGTCGSIPLAAEGWQGHRYKK